MISPSGYPAQIGGILDHKNESVMFARPGENVQIKLIHIDDEDMIKKGDELREFIIMYIINLRKSLFF